MIDLELRDFGITRYVTDATYGEVWIATRGNVPESEAYQVSYLTAPFTWVSASLPLLAETRRRLCYVRRTPPPELDLTLALWQDGDRAIFRASELLLCGEPSYAPWDRRLLTARENWEPLKFHDLRDLSPSTPVEIRRRASYRA